MGISISIPSLILDGVAVLITVISLIVGIKRGFFKSLALLLAVVAAIFVSMTFSDRFAGWLNEKFVSENVNEKISGMLQKLIPAETADTSVPEGGENGGSGNTGDDKSFLEALTNGEDVFSEILKRLGSSVDGLIDQIKGKAGDSLKSAVDALSKPLSEKISKGVAVIILFAATLIFSLIIIKLFDVIFSTKPLSGINRLLGGIVGLLKGLLLTFIFCYAACRLVPSIAGLTESIPTDIIEKTFIVKHFGFM